MKRFLVVSSFFSFALCSTTALAQMPPPAQTQSTWDHQPAPAAPLTDGPGNGFQINVDPLAFSGSIALVEPLSGSVSEFGSQASVAVGYQFDQNAFLLDIGFTATSGTDIFFEFSPVYRRYFSPLRTGTVIPFAEGGVTFAIAAPSGESSAFAIGFGGGAGAEFLFTKNMGLEAAATLGYLHTNTGSAGNLETGLPANVDSIGLGGKVGLVIHL